MIVLIHAYERQYEGYHGMHQTFVADYDNKNQILEDAIQASYEVMNDYDEIYTCLEEEARECCEDEDDFDDALEEVMRENVEFEVYELTNVPDNVSARELDELVVIEGVDAIIEKYQGKEIEF